MSDTDSAADTVLRALRDRVGDKAVAAGEADLFAYAGDLWPKLTIEHRDGGSRTPPLAVVRPRDEEAVLATLEVLRQHRTPVVPFGAGSGVCGGAAPLFGGVVLDLKHLDHFGAIDEASLQITVGPGLILQNLEERLNALGYTLGHFPSSIYCASIGGCVATRGAGQLSSRYGKIEDMVTGLRICSPELGTVETGSLDATGSLPDWTPLIMGSEGTLAVITAIRLRLHPLPSSLVLRGVRFPSMDAGIEGFRTILHAGLRPSVLRLYDPLDTWMAMQKGEDPGGARPQPGGGSPLVVSAHRFRPENAARPVVGEPSGSDRIFGSVVAPGTLVGAAVGRLRGHRKKHRSSHKEGLLDGVKERLITDRLKALTQPDSPALARLLQQPSLVNKTISLLPGRCLAILGCEGEEDVANQHLDAALAACRRVGATDLGPGPGEQWFRTRYHVSFKLPKLLGSGGFADTFETAAPWTRIHALYQTVRRAVASHVLVMAHLSHAYHEGCSIYFTFVGRGANPQATQQLYTRTWDTALAAALDAGATLSHHHGVGFLKRDFMDREHGEARHLFEVARRALAPEQSLNPGKLFPETVPAPGPPAAEENPRLLQVHAFEDGVAEAGTDWTGAELAAELSLRGHFLPPLGRAFLEQRLDRWLAGSAIPAHVAIHGAWEYPVLAVGGRFPDGRAWSSGRLPRSAAGPNYFPFGVGAEALPTEATRITLRTLTPPPLRTAGFAFDHMEKAVDALRRSLRGASRPLAGAVYAGTAPKGYQELGRGGARPRDGGVVYLCLQEPDGFPAANDHLLRQLQAAGGRDLSHDAALAWWEDHWAEAARIGSAALQSTGPQASAEEIGRCTAVIGWRKALLLLRAIETLCGGSNAAHGWIEAPLETGCTLHWRFQSSRKTDPTVYLVPHQIEQTLRSFGARIVILELDESEPCPEGTHHGRGTSAHDDEGTAQATMGPRLTRAIAEELAEL